ncbi:MAG TPA: glycoside hydrolase family 3 C-terminal domain-containing protein [Candidatus Sulfotelmatobacter sp.]|nr:glycoside hydrolase family 3 C-terminal domain-containing protein [Candidatus Sulfotelmatobacter sp.]
MSRLERRFRRVFILMAAVSVLTSGSSGQFPGMERKHYPWSETSLSPDARADLVIKELTLDEKISLLHGNGLDFFSTKPSESNGGAGYSVSIPRLGIPAIQMADSAYGVTQGAKAGRYSTALPNNLGAASSWDAQTAFEYGTLIGRELRNEGYNMTLGGGVNLAREPRNGRTFEYQGEDPLLAGTLAGNLIKGVQSQNVIGDTKHYAINDQESGRNAVNANIDKRSMRESDLLAFQIALEIGDPGAVMCSYNRLNGDYACENSYLLTDVLKKDLQFKGFVVSDWGGAHSAAKASHAGLDQEQPDQYFFGDALKKAVESGEVSQAELDDHVHRILRTIFAKGLFDHPVERQVPDVEAGMAFAQSVAEKSIVLLRNDKHVLPLDPAKVRSLVLIGGHADVGVLTGGGSAQVDPPGGSAVPPPPPGPDLLSMFLRPAWLPSSPLRAFQAQFPAAKVSYVAGDRLDEATSAAKNADAAIVFAYAWESEGFDLKTLDLPEEQNRLIEAVAAANPRTIVVLETGSPATMPWVNKVAGVIEAWYPGIRGAEALANIVAGKVNPSAKLAITFPKSDADLPHPKLVMPPPESEPKFPGPGGDFSEFMKTMAKGLPAFQVYYDEKLKVGYKWYDAEKKTVLFPFGFGLSYTTFAYSDISVSGSDAPSVSFTVKNTGSRAGTEIAQVYSSLPEAAGEPPKRLVGWSRVELGPGESKKVTVPVSRERLSIYEEGSNSWKLVPGSYRLMVGGSSQDLPLPKEITLQ